MIAPRCSSVFFFFFFLINTRIDKDWIDLPRKWIMWDQNWNRTKNNQLKSFYIGPAWMMMIRDQVSLRLESILKDIIIHCLSFVEK